MERGLGLGGRGEWDLSARLAAANGAESEARDVEDAHLPHPLARHSSSFHTFRDRTGWKTQL